MKRAKPASPQSKGLKSKESAIQTAITLLWLPMPLGFSWIRISIAPFLLILWTGAAAITVKVANSFGIPLCGGSFPLVCWVPMVVTILPLYVNRRKMAKLARATNVDPKVLYSEGAPKQLRYSILPTYARVLWYLGFATVLATYIVWRSQVTVLSHSQIFEQPVLRFTELLWPWVLIVVVTVLVFVFLEWWPFTHWFLLETKVVAYLTVTLALVLIAFMTGWYGYASCSEWWFQITGICLPR